MKTRYLLWLLLVQSASAGVIFNDSFEEGVLPPQNLRLLSASETSLGVEWDVLQQEVESVFVCYSLQSFNGVEPASFNGINEALKTFAEANGGNCINNTYSTKWLVRKLEAGTELFFIATAKRANKISPVSEEFLVNTDVLPPASVKAKGFGVNSQVSWKDNSDATSYTVYVSELPFPLETMNDRMVAQLSAFAEANNGKIYKDIPQGTQSVLITDLTVAKHYYYVITAAKDQVIGYASPLYTLTAPGSMNDTGVRVSEAFETGADTTCVKNTLGSEDCLFGRDAINDDALDGVAGFSFTKLDAEGNVLEFDSEDAWACVKDNVTGLVWEVKSARNAKQEFSQYDPIFGDKFDLNENAKDGGDDGVWAGVPSGITTQSYIEQANRRKLCGFSDWRLPSKTELHSIVYYGQQETNELGALVLMDLNYFPFAQSRDYWTASPVADSFRSAWTVYFATGEVRPRKRDSKRLVRLVLGNQ